MHGVIRKLDDAEYILENCAGLTDLCVRAAKRLKRGT